MVITDEHTCLNLVNNGKLVDKIYYAGFDLPKLDRYNTEPTYKVMDHA